MTTTSAVAVRSTDRLFLSCPVPADAAATMIAVAERLRLKHRLAGKQVPPEQLSIKLFSFGEFVGIPRDLVERIHRVAEGVRLTPFEVAFDRIGSLLGRERNLPVALWESSASSALRDFKLPIAAGFAHLKPSGSLTRSLGSSKGVTVAYDHSAVPEEVVEAISWTVRDFTLVQSRLGKSERIELGRWGLGN